MRLIRIHTQEPNSSGSRDGVTPDMLVIHTTDTKSLARISTNTAWNLERIAWAESAGGISSATAENLRRVYSTGVPMSDAVSLCLIAASTDREASWHYCVASLPLPGEDECEVVELVPPNLQAHHVGAIGGTVNKRSIGIENVYYGAISKSISFEKAKATYAEFGWSAPYLLRGPDGVTRWYTPPSEAQIRTLVNLCRLLADEYPIKEIEGHHKYYPSNRIDPDPPINLSALRNAVFSKGNTYSLLSKASIGLLLSFVLLGGIIAYRD